MGAIVTIHAVKAAILAGLDKFFHLLLEEGESFVRYGLLQASAVEIDAFLKNNPLHLVLRRGAKIDFKDQPLRLLVGLFDGRLERIVFSSQRVNRAQKIDGVLLRLNLPEEALLLRAWLLGLRQKSSQDNESIEDPGR